MPKLNENEKKLFDLVEKDCKKYDIDFVRSRHKSVNTGDSGRVSGFFDEQTLSVALKSYNWVHILAHEYSHLRQWVEKDETYTAKNHDGSCPIMTFTNWVNGVENNAELALESTKKVIALERNCEMRAYKLLERYDLVQSKAEKIEYKQLSNAYLYSHWVSYEHKLWPKSGWSKKLDYNVIPKSFRCEPHRKDNKKIHKHILRSLRGEIE